MAVQEGQALAMSTNSSGTASGDEIGPVDFAVIAFPGNKFNHQIVPALRELVDAGTVRIIDLVFVIKDQDGNTAAVELSALDPDEASTYDDLDGEFGGLLNDEDMELAAEGLEPGSSAALIVWENTWAARLAGAIRGSKGELVMLERIPHDAVVEALTSAQTT